MNAYLPIIWKCIDLFKKKKILIRLKIIQLIAVNTMGFKWKDHAEKIIKIYDDYHTRINNCNNHNFQFPL